jgi:hypothetical protein
MLTSLLLLLMQVLLLAPSSTAPSHSVHAHQTDSKTAPVTHKISHVWRL